MKGKNTISTMNRGYIQSERAASAQRDLFDNQLRIEDQLIEQKSEPHHPGSRKAHTCKRCRQPEGVETRTFYPTDGPFAGREHARTMCRFCLHIVNDRLIAHGATISSITDTFNSKL